jgi:hypothetical protein
MPELINDPPSPPCHQLSPETGIVEFNDLLLISP